MELKKQFTFSGIFKKFHEEDSEPVEISVADIYCYTNGSILMEIASEVNQSINYKKFFECAPKSKSEGKTIEGRVISSFEGWMGILSPGYEGDYKIEGTTNEGWRINAITIDCGFTVTFKSDDSIDIGQENKCQVRLRDLCIDYDIEPLEEGGEIQEVVYGLANIEIGRNFSASVGNLDAEVYFDRVSIGTVDRNGVLSAEMTLRNIRENEQSSYEECCGWLIYLLSFASGCYVDQIYKIEPVRHKDLQIKREYWPGGELHDARVRGIAVMQSPDDLDVFM